MLVNSPHDLQAICQGFVHLSAVCSLMQIWSLKLKLFLSLLQPGGYVHHPGPGAWVSMIMLLDLENSLVDTLFVSHAQFSALSGPGGLPSYCNLVAFIFPRQFVV